jgi:hypothetical protein
LIQIKTRLKRQLQNVHAKNQNAKKIIANVSNLENSVDNSVDAQIVATKSSSLKDQQITKKFNKRAKNTSVNVKRVNVKKSIVCAILTVENVESNVNA